jgi:hypothetical protein
MERSCYSIEKHHDRWSISVCGAKVLICDSKKTAVKLVRQATDALCLDRGGAASGCGRDVRSWSGDCRTEASACKTKATAN